MKKVLSSLELLNDLAICFTEEQLLASQVAVLTTLPGSPVPRRASLPIIQD